MDGTGSTQPLFGTAPGPDGFSRTINLDDIFSDCFFGPIGEVVPSTSQPPTQGSLSLPVSSSSASAGGGRSRGAAHDAEDEDEEDGDGEEDDGRGGKRPRMRQMSEQQKVERR